MITPGAIELREAMFKNRWEMRPADQASLLIIGRDNFNWFIPIEYTVFDLMSAIEHEALNRRIAP